MSGSSNLNSFRDRGQAAVQLVSCGVPLPLRLLNSGSKLFITFELKHFSTRGREIPCFSADFSICPKPRAASAARPRWAPKVNRLLPRRELNLLTFLKSPKSSAHPSGAWCHSHPPVTIPNWDFYFDICEWHILPLRAWTHALMMHLTNQCAKRKVLSLTKPKVKINKMKSLGHYITHFHYFFFCFWKI